MTSAYHAWLPFPPSVNNLFSQGIVKGRVRRFPSKKYKAWRKEAFTRLRLARIPHFTGPVAIKLTLTPPTAARRDVDNYSKAVLDALVDAHILADDSQVQKLLSAWDHSAEPGAIVEIGEIGSERPALTPVERLALGKLRRAGNRLVPPRHRKSKTTRALIEKGYVEELPGLFADAPQGFRTLD